ncbi:MAG: peptidase T [Actinobacteria bacterium]|nr:peptidase T [Actinomycetota bacterium]
MTDHAPYTSPLAAELGPDVRDRFLRYVTIDTQSDPDSSEFPSTAKQLDLSRMLVDELQELGVTDARLEDGYVMASLDGTGSTVVALLAHVDTTSDAPGAGVKPRLIENYDGGDITYDAAPGLLLSPVESPDLRAQKGRDVITTDGTTLLGADDKAGVAAIMTAVHYLHAHADAPRPPLRICFTPDEEVGKGISHLDLDALGAEVAYTLDGSTAGTIEDESFSADEMIVRFTGRQTHPGTAKDKMVNAMRLAGRFLDALPYAEAPETTSDREGFVHPYSIEGAVSEVTLRLILRDFDTGVLEERGRRMTKLAEATAAPFTDASVEVTITEQYRNMKDHLRERPEVAGIAVRAIETAGLKPIQGFIRGGTDGSMLTAKGLPTPNLFTGMHDIHSLKEWVSVQDMADSAATIVHLVRAWSKL